MRRVALVALVALVAIIGAALLRLLHERRTTRAAERAETRVALAKTPPPAEAVVLVGDETVTRLGIPGHDLGIPGCRAGELAELTGLVVHAAPGRVVLSVGRHDLTDGRPIADIVNDVATLVDEIQQHQPSASVTICGLAPIHGRWSRAVPTVNAELQRVAAERRVDYRAA